MNGKQLACVVLMAIIGAITYVAQIVHKKSAAMLQSAEASEAAAADADMNRNIAEKTAERTRFEATEKHRFLQSWQPFIDKVQTQQEVEQSVMASLRTSSVFASSQKFEVRTNRDIVVPTAVRASLVTEDEYAKPLNWLGELESKLPLLRVNNCRITGAQDPKNVRMEVALEVPLVNLAADPLNTVTK